MIQESEKVVLVLDLEETDVKESVLEVNVPKNRDEVLERLRLRTSSREIRFIGPER